MKVFLGTYWEVLEAMQETVGVDLAIVEDKPTAERVADLARQNALPLVVLAKGDRLAECFPATVSLAVVGSFGRLLKTEVIGRCHRILNVHPGIVETCRGRHTLPVDVLRGEDQMGITCHLIEDERIDAGPIAAQIRLPIDYTVNFDVNHARLRSFLKPLLAPVLDLYRQEGDFPVLSWNPAPDSYHPPLTPERLRMVLDAARLDDVRGLGTRMTCA